MILFLAIRRRGVTFLKKSYYNSLNIEYSNSIMA